jgi:hypothetical protein
MVLEVIMRCGPSSEPLLRNPVEVSTPVGWREGLEGRRCLDVRERAPILARPGHRDLWAVFGLFRCRNFLRSGVLRKVGSHADDHEGDNRM